MHPPPRPRQAGLKLPSWWTLLQKAAIASLCTLSSVNDTMHSLLIRWHRFYQLAPWRLMDDISYYATYPWTWIRRQKTDFFTGTWAVRNNSLLLLVKAYSLSWLPKVGRQTFFEVYSKSANSFPNRKSANFLRCASPQIANLLIFMINPQILNSQIFWKYCQFSLKKQ